MQIISKAYSSALAQLNRAKVSKINKLKDTLGLASMSDESLKSLAESVLTKDPSNDKIIEVFAIVKEVIYRIKGIQLHDCQLEGGLHLLERRVSEMKTGEGKTLTIVAPAVYLASNKKGLHVVTANEYLASRDALLMAPIYEYLGLSCKALVESDNLVSKKTAYLADITYGVSHSFGFDYLRDNTAKDKSDKVQRGLYAAIVDEVDSILIDDARTPMILSVSVDSTDSSISAIADFVNKELVAEDVHIDLAKNEASVTDSGFSKFESFIESTGLLAHNESAYSVKNSHLVSNLTALVSAKFLYAVNRDYIVRNGDIILVDTGTGRTMEGRRLSRGIHEALEALEGVPLKPTTKTMATISYQNFFGQYSQLSGLSGTALTDAMEFSSMYNMEVVEIPTHKPVIRKQIPDKLFLNKLSKFKAITSHVIEVHKSGQPVLIGCESIRDAEIISSMLEDMNVEHQTLTAKFVDLEASIIAEAGVKFAVTVATNMAGRGTDILLGGDPSDRDPIEVSSAKQEVLELGGLHVVGASRNLLRRVDNQLLGRSGRQGDPGSYAFFVSLDDDLLINMRNHKLFYAISKSIGDGEISGKVVSRLISMSQQKHEQTGFMDRENLMKYDSVNASQQQVVYATRSAVLGFENISDFYPLIEDAVTQWANSAVYAHPDVSSIKYLELKESLNSSFNIDPPLLSWLKSLTQDELVSAIQAEVISAINAIQRSPIELRDILLKSMDEHWSIHLEALADLRSNIGYRASVGKNPVFAFNIEAKDLFHEFDAAFKLDFVYQLTINQSKAPGEVSYAPASMTPAQKVFIALKKRPVGRNDPCPCDSGLRFKECHGLDPRFV